MELPHYVDTSTMMEPITLNLQIGTDLDPHATRILDQIYQAVWDPVYLQSTIESIMQVPELFQVYKVHLLYNSHTLKAAEIITSLPMYAGTFFG